MTHYDMGIRPNDDNRNWEGDGAVFGYVDYVPALADAMVNHLADVTGGGSVDCGDESDARWSIFRYLSRLGVEKVPDVTIVGEWTIVKRPGPMDDCPWCGEPERR